MKKSWHFKLWYLSINKVLKGLSPLFGVYFVFKGECLPIQLSTWLLRGSFCCLTLRHIPKMPLKRLDIRYVIQIGCIIYKSFFYLQYSCKLQYMVLIFWLKETGYYPKIKRQMSFIFSSFCDSWLSFYFSSMTDIDALQDL